MTHVGVEGVRSRELDIAGGAGVEVNRGQGLAVVLFVSRVGGLVVEDDGAAVAATELGLGGGGGGGG